MGVEDVAQSLDVTHGCSTALALSAGHLQGGGVIQVRREQGNHGACRAQCSAGWALVLGGIASSGR